MIQVVESENLGKGDTRFVYGHETHSAVSARR